MRQVFSYCEPLPLNDSLLTHLRVPVKASSGFETRICFETLHRHLCGPTTVTAIQFFGARGDCSAVIGSGKGDPSRCLRKCATIPSVKGPHRQGKYNLGVQWITW